MVGLSWVAIMAGGLAAVYAALTLGQPDGISLNGVTVAAGVVLLSLERFVPEQPAWTAADDQWWQDLGHLFLGFVLGSFGGAALAQSVVPAPVWDVWPARWPLVAQAALGLVVAEFFGYWQHRALHRIPVLWHWHALHHSTARMTFFKTTRIHAVDIGSFTFLSIAPLLALGAPLSVVVWVTAFGNFAALTQHANVRLRTPSWLNAAVGTPAVHWLHHSLDKREGDSNFGMNVMLWDHVFGTYLAPGREPRVTLGIAPDHVPATFLGQLLLPWRTVRDLTTRS